MGSDFASRGGSQVEAIRGRSVLNSIGRWIVEVQVELRNGVVVTASAPEGTTVGHFDLGKTDVVRGLGLCRQADERLRSETAFDQARVDEVLRALFGEFGELDSAANVSCAISMATAYAAALTRRVPFWLHLSEVFGTAPTQPGLIVNMVSGGAHNDTGLEVTEGVLVLPSGQVRASLRMATSFLRKLEPIVASEYGPTALASGIEGGLTPTVQRTESLFELFDAAIGSDAELEPCRYGADLAGNWLQRQERFRDVSQSASIFRAWRDRFPRLTYLEDPYSDTSREAWAGATRDLGATVMIAGDDLLATSVDRLVEAHREDLVNACVAKVDHAGTISDLARFCSLAASQGTKTVISHRSRETDTSYVADMAVGLGADYFKGGCCTRERIIKYNRLLRISDELAISEDMLATSSAG